VLNQVIIVLLGCVAAGAVLMALASIRVSAGVRRQRWLKFFSYLAIVLLVLGCAAFGRPWLVGLVALILLVGIWELHGATVRIRQERRALAWLVWLIYGLLSCGVAAVTLAVAINSVVFIYLVVAAFDGFSQVVGQWLGSHRLAPRLSPGKTVEGMFGGMAGALFMALFIREIAALSVSAALAAGMFIAPCALAGDLAASWVTRRAGIKDFSPLLPGQGGMLDRFDSFIGAVGLLSPLLLLLAG